VEVVLEAEEVADVLEEAAPVEDGNVFNIFPSLLEDRKCE
jgi:hypothetical protein